MRIRRAWHQGGVGGGGRSRRPCAKRPPSLQRSAPNGLARRSARSAVPQHTARAGHFFSLAPSDEAVTTKQEQRRNVLSAPPVRAVSSLRPCMAVPERHFPRVWHPAPLHRRHCTLGSPTHRCAAAEPSPALRHAAVSPRVRLSGPREGAGRCACWGSCHARLASAMGPEAACAARRCCLRGTALLLARHGAASCAARRCFLRGTALLLARHGAALAASAPHPKP